MYKHIFHHASCGDLNTQDQKLATKVLWTSINDDHVITCLKRTINLHDELREGTDKLSISMTNLLIDSLGEWRVSHLQRLY